MSGPSHVADRALSRGSVTDGRWEAAEEYSAGGVVTRDGKVLLVKVRNLQGDILWTFPKGHLESGETPREAATREVEEETGWRCRVVAPLALLRYRFLRGGRLVRKRVRWYWMRPESLSREPDAREVLGLRWSLPDRAGRTLRYRGDLRLLALVKRRLEGGGKSVDDIR